MPILDTSVSVHVCFNNMNCHNYPNSQSRTMEMLKTSFLGQAGRQDGRPLVGSLYWCIDAKKKSHGGVKGGGSLRRGMRCACAYKVYYRRIV